MVSRRDMLCMMLLYRILTSFEDKGFDFFELKKNNNNINPPPRFSRDCGVGLINVTT